MEIRACRVKHLSGARRAVVVGLTVTSGLMSAGAVSSAHSRLAPRTTAPSPAASAFVRVNQVGYPAGGSKRAYLMSSLAEPGATFSLIKAGVGTVFSAPVGANLGSWSGTYPFVYALDFSGVTAA